MTGFPGSPRLLKGAIVGLDRNNPVSSIVIFQYNPASMTRKLDARGVGGDSSDRSEALRLTGPPKETITISIEIDATDQLELGDPLAIVAGISPTLSALEILLYPKSEEVIANQVLSAGGLLSIVPMEAPLTLFVWGPSRVLPVRITSFSITEESFDTLLNPTSAKVDLSMLVLSYHDLQATNPGSTLFMAYQIAKETMAVMNLGADVVNIGKALKIF